MTFAFHHYSGTVLGILIARLFGWDPWFMGIVGFVLGGFQDTGSWLIWKITNANWWKWSVWGRWDFYVRCHPVPFGGEWDKYGKWIPFWGQHTWLWDSIVHTDQPKFLFPQFKEEWKNEVWLRIWPTHWNIQLTKWDVLYGLLEISLWFVYTMLLVVT